MGRTSKNEEWWTPWRHTAKHVVCAHVRPRNKNASYIPRQLGGRSSTEPNSDQKEFHQRAEAIRAKSALAPRSHIVKDLKKLSFPALPHRPAPAAATGMNSPEPPPNPHQDQIEKVALVQFKLKKMVCPPSHVSMTKVQIPVSNLQHRPAIRFEIFSWHQLNWMTHPFIWKYSGSQKFLLTPFFDTCQGRWFLWRGGGRFRRNKKLHSVGIGRWSPSDGPEEYALKMLIH